MIASVVRSFHPFVNEIFQNSLLMIFSALHIEHNI